MTFKYQGSVCSDLIDTKKFIDSILDKVSLELKDPDLMFDLKLILNELIINGVVHGNCNNKDKCVTLYLEITGNRLRIEVKDEGEGIEYSHKYDPSELKNCGRGLVLVNGLTDEVIIDRNRIVAVKNF